MGKGKRRMNLMEKASEYFDLPGEIAGVPRITVTGCRRVLIENHRGILGYGENEISVNGRRMIVKVRGDGLDIRSMDSYEIAVEGIITSVDFEFIDLE